VPLLLVIAAFPVATAQRVLLAHLGPPGKGLMNLMFPITTTLAMIGSLVLLSARALRARDANAGGAGSVTGSGTLRVMRSQ
jgi:hypothetical protein